MIHSSQNSSHSFWLRLFFSFFLKKKWTGAETIRAQPAGLITVLRNYGSCTPKLQSNSVSSYRRGNASSKHGDVRTDVMVRIYLEGKCSISWAF